MLDSGLCDGLQRPVWRWQVADVPLAIGDISNSHCNDLRLANGQRTEPGLRPNGNQIALALQICTILRAWFVAQANYKRENAICLVHGDHFSPGAIVLGPIRTAVPFDAHAGKLATRSRSTADRCIVLG